VARRRWAQLIRRIYEIEPFVCPRCGWRLRIIACLTDPRVVGAILKHLADKGVDARSPPAPATTIDAARSPAPAGCSPARALRFPTRQAPVQGFAWVHAPFSRSEKPEPDR
jgi:hypothetical protein